MTESNTLLPPGTDVGGRGLESGANKVQLWTIARVALGRDITA